LDFKLIHLDRFLVQQVRTNLLFNTHKISLNSTEFVQSLVETKIFKQKKELDRKVILLKFCKH